MKLMQLSQKTGDVMKRKMTFRLICITVALASPFVMGNHVEAVTVSLEDIDSGLTSPTGNYRWLDVADQTYYDNYRSNYDYTKATVEVVYDAIGNTLHGTLNAANLKPNFAYQLKLAGNLDIDADANEHIGLAGRWWQEEWDGTQWTNGQNLNNKGDGSFPSPNDDTYSARRDIPDATSPTGLHYRYTGYLVFDYFITDEDGNASLEFETNSSFHVLWKTTQRTWTTSDGPIKTTTFDVDPLLSPAYDTDYEEATISIFGEWERLPVGGIFLQPGDYIAEIILTEESFHGSGGTFAGNWAAAMGAEISFNITQPDRIIDNTDLDFSTLGNWPASTMSPGFSGTNYQYAPAGNGSMSASWTFDISAPGQYKISAQWAAHSNRAPNAPYAIYNNGQMLDTVIVDQRIYGGQQNLLGTYVLSSGTLEVVLSNDASGFVIADAVRVTLIDQSEIDRIIDNTDLDFSTLGNWPASTMSPGFSGTNYQYAPAGNGAMSASWTFDISAPGQYKISAQWAAHSNRAPNAPYAIYNNGQMLDTVIVDQRIDGGQQNLLGTYVLSSGTLEVVLSNDASGFVIADAVRVTLIDQSEIDRIIDNTDLDFSTLGNWPASTMSPGFSGTNYQYAPAGNGAMSASWTFDISAPGQYKISAQWAAHSNRAPNAPYAIYNNGQMLDTVIVDQRIDGGQQNLLGTYVLSSGTLEVVLSNDASGFVIADAVRVTLIDPQQNSHVLNSVKVMGQYLLVAGSDVGFQILDIADHAEPYKIGELSVAGGGYAIDTYDSYAYLARGVTGVAIIDISDPTQPVSIKTIGTPSPTKSLLVAQDHLFVTAGDSGVLIYDIANPQNPQLVGQYVSVGEASALDVFGTSIFLADNTNDLKVVDITDINNPKLMATLNLPAKVINVKIRGHYAFVICENGQLQIVDYGWPKNMTVVSTYQIWTEGSLTSSEYFPGSLYLSDAYVLVGNRTSGMQIIDVTEKENPELVEYVALSGSLHDIDANAHYGFLASSDAKVQVVELPEYLSRISHMAQFDTPGYTRGIKVQGGRLLVADDWAGLRVIDISDPYIPMEVGQITNVGNVWAIDTFSNFAYLAARENGLIVIDLTIPSDPRLVQVIDTPDAATDVFVSGHHLFVGVKSSGLLIYDITDPESPQFVSQYDTPGLSVGVYVVEDRVYVADYHAGLQVLDISNSNIEHPVLLGSLSTLGNLWDVKAIGEYIYVVGEQNGLQIIDATFPAQMRVIGHVQTPDLSSPVTTVLPPFSLQLMGNHALIADGGSGLQIIDITVKTNPYIVDSLQLEGFCWGLEVNGKHAFVGAYGAGVHIIDTSFYTSELTAIAQFDTFGTIGQTRGVRIRDNYLFQCDGPSGMRIIDISDPTKPFRAGKLDKPDPPYWNVFNLDFYGSYAYVANRETGVLVVDISDITHPNLVTTINTIDSATDVQVKDTTLFVADRRGGLLLFDITDPENPIFMSQYKSIDNPLDEVLGLDVVGYLVYIANYFSGLTVVDISDSLNPIKVGSLDFIWKIWDVKVRGQYAYAVGEGSGLLIIDCSNPAQMFTVGRAVTPDEELSNTDSPPFTVLLSGNYAFLGDGLSGLQVIDITTTAPKVIDSIKLPGYSWGVDMRGDNVFVGAFFDGVHVVNASKYLQGN